MVQCYISSHTMKSDPWNDKDGPWKQYTEWKKPARKTTLLGFWSQFQCVGVDWSGFTLTPSISQTPARCLRNQLDSDTFYPETASDSTGYGFSLNKTAHSLQLQMPVTSPGCYLCFCLTGYKLEVPTSPFFGLTTLLGQLTELREAWTFTSLL